MFGNTTSVSVGSNNATSSNVTLVTNTYKDNNGMLETSIYGNGFGYEYEYDKKYNIKSIKQISPNGNKSTAVEYVYDTNGNLKRKKDLLSNVEYTYNYDFINRPDSVKGSDGSEYKLTYDKKNRVVGVDSKTELGTVTTEYVYGDTSLKQFNDVVYKVKHNGNENISYNDYRMSRN